VKKKFNFMKKKLNFALLPAWIINIYFSHRQLLRITQRERTWQKSITASGA